MNQYEIINSQLQSLIHNRTVDTIVLDKNLNDLMLNYAESFIIAEDDKITQSYGHNHNLDNYLIKNLFNQKEVEHYRKNFGGQKKIDVSKLNSPKRFILNEKGNTTEHQNFNKRLISLSKPIFNMEGEFAMIAFYDGSYLRDTGQTGFSIFKLENAKWVLIETVIMEIS